jgi:hypothetical protein
MVHTFLGGYAAASGGNMACAADGNSGTTFSAKNVGGVITKSAGINDGQIMYLPLDPTAATRRMLFVDVTKGSPNYSFSWFYCLSATASPDVTQADFTTQVQAATPSFTNHAFRGTTATGLAFSEAAGTLDCVNVFWPLQMHRMHICDVAAVKIA